VSALEGANVVTRSAATSGTRSDAAGIPGTVPLAVGGDDRADAVPGTAGAASGRELPRLCGTGGAGNAARGRSRDGAALTARDDGGRIVTYEGDLAAASYPQSVTVELEDEIDLSRGRCWWRLNRRRSAARGEHRFRAMVVWMHEDPLVVGRTYIAKHTTRTVRATARAIRYRVDVNNLDHLASDTVAMNGSRRWSSRPNLPLFFDSYREALDGIADPYRRADNATWARPMIVGPAGEVAEGAPGDRKDAALILLPGRGELAVRVAMRWRRAASGHS